MKTVALVLLFFFITFNGNSQEEEHYPDSLYVVTMNSGESRIGKIVSDDGREILLLSTEIGKIYILKENIKSITPYIEKDFQNVQGELRAAGSFTTRYCFTTNSLPIKKGENYALVNLYGPDVHFAVSNRFSIGVMATWIASPIVLAAKFTIPTKNEKLNFGLGTLMGTSGYLNAFRGFGGLHWGMVTFGDRLNNITLSTGFSYVNTGIIDEVDEYTPGIFPVDQDGYIYMTPIGTRKNNSPTSLAPVIGIGGIAKVGKKASFIFDAMLFFGRTKGTGYEQHVEYISDPTTGQPLYTKVPPIQLTSFDRSSTVALFMPAMRFQRKDTRAFQISLAGAVYKTETETRSFPIPMVTWFFKF